MDMTLAVRKKQAVRLPPRPNWTQVVPAGLTQFLDVRMQRWVAPAVASMNVGRFLLVAHCQT